LHAGVAIAASDRETLERLCRYVSRPPVAADRLAPTPSGHVRYTLKTPYRDGTTHLVLEPLELMARLAARVPPPTPRHVATSRARRPKRVFRIDIETCARCGGQLRIIAAIEESAVIAKILAHSARIVPQSPPTECSPGARAPPGLWLAGRGVGQRARPGIERPALRPTAYPGRRTDRPRTVGLRPGPGLLARYANSPGTGRWFAFPIRSSATGGVVPRPGVGGRTVERAADPATRGAGSKGRTRA